MKEKTLKGKGKQLNAGANIGKCRRNDCVYSLAGSFVADAFGKPSPAGPHGSPLNPSKRPPFFLFPREDRLAASHLLVRGSPRTNPRGESLNADVKRAMVALKLPLMTRYIPGQCECSCVSNNVFLSRGSDIGPPAQASLPDRFPHNIRLLMIDRY